MGDHDDGVLEVDEELLEPLDCLHVKVVGRLVQKEDVRVAEQCLREEDLDLERAFQVPHQFMVIFRADAEAQKQALRVGLGFPAVHFREFGLELGCPDAVLVGEILLHVEGILLLADVVETAVAHDDGVEDFVVVVFEMVLLEEGNALARRHRDGAGGGFKLSVENLQECGLAGSVRSDESVAVAFGEFDVDIRKQGLLAHPVSDIVCCDHVKLLFPSLYIACSSPICSTIVTGES